MPRSTGRITREKFTITGLDSFPKGGDIVDLCELLDGKTETDILHMIERMIEKTPPEAKDLFTRFFNSNVDERIGLNGDMKAFWAKFTSYVARLALVFHVVQRIEDGTPMDELPGETMQRAIRLIMWFKREAARILQLLRRTKCEIDFEAQAVLDLIERNGGVITVRELQHRHNKYRDKDGAKTAEGLLEGLVRQGKLTSEQVVASNGKAILRYGLT